MKDIVYLEHDCYVLFRVLLKPLQSLFWPSLYEKEEHEEDAKETDDKKQSHELDWNVTPLDKRCMKIAKLLAQCDKQVALT